MILVTGRNYAGKTTIKNKLARKIGLKNATIFTTRKKTPQDMIRTNYRFVSIEEFEKMKEQGVFKVVTTNGSGQLSGILHSEFERSDAILELDLSSLISIINDLPDSCKVIFVDAAVEARFCRMVKDNYTIYESFRILHKENFNGYELPFGIAVDNSLEDNGECATRSIINSLSQYSNLGVVNAQNMKSKKIYVSPIIYPNNTSNIRSFLSYEQWALREIRKVCNLSDPEGRKFAKTMYRNYLFEYRTLNSADFRYNSSTQELGINLDGIYFPLAKDEALAPDIKGVVREKIKRER